MPQFVSVTFDDGFGLEAAGDTGGINYIVPFYAGMTANGATLGGSKVNPSGTPPDPKNFDGTPLHATFYYTSFYIQPANDATGGNLTAWQNAFAAGHEAANHTVNHSNGGPVKLVGATNQNFTVAGWTGEISGCTTALSAIGANATDIVGFRSPYLGYNDNLYPALLQQKLVYDSTIPNCFDDTEDGTNCSWPYTLDNGSPDQVVLSRKFTKMYNSVAWTFPTVTSHPGIWQMPPTTLIIPPDSAATQYNFKSGLCARIQANASTLLYPDVWDNSNPQLCKIAGLDYSLLNDAMIAEDEMRAILEYNLDLHLKGNRSPFIFIAHTFNYAFDPNCTTAACGTNTPSITIRNARWKALTDFINYAHAKSDVRIVNVKDILAWVRRVSGK